MSSGNPYTDVNSAIWRVLRDPDWSWLFKHVEPELIEQLEADIELEVREALNTWVS